MCAVGWKIPLTKAAGLRIEGVPVGCYLVVHLDFCTSVPMTSKLIVPVHFQGVNFLLMQISVAQVAFLYLRVPVSSPLLSAALAELLLHETDDSPHLVLKNEFQYHMSQSGRGFTLK